ncbi:MAG: oligosaccharide flippase family protein [Nitrospira sp. CR1.2]|nr:oligosaccharide flippase family protein [Nitrospira sp. CR1.2]
MRNSWSGIKTLSQQTALVFAGKMTGACLGFAMSLIVARQMGPEEFGLFSLFIVILILGNDILGDGLSPGVVRFYSMYRRVDPPRAAEVLTNALALRVLLGIPIVALGLAGAVHVAGGASDRHSYVLPVVLGLIGSFGAALWSFALCVWQAREEFAVYGAMVALVNLLRVLGIPLLLWAGWLSLGPVMGLHVLFYYACTAWGIWLLRAHLALPRLDTALLRDLLRFSKWPAMASLFFILQINLGVPVLNYVADAREAGLYGAGSSLLMGVDFLTVSLVTTLLPKITQLTGLEQCRSYVQRAFPLYALIAVCLLPVLYFARPLVVALFGPAYEGTIVIFQVLFIGTLGTLVTHPLYLVLYTMDRPHWFGLIQGFALLGWIVAGCLLIPGFGALGAAWTTLIARMLQSLAIIVVLGYALGFLWSSKRSGNPMAEGTPGT